MTYAYHTDAQGSVVAITDPAGTVVASYRYDAFGAVTYTGGSDPALAARNPLRYRGYYLDAATGLYYLPARYFDPATARFLSQDPAPPSAGDPFTLNAYAYCVGDPANFTDPDGARHEAGGGGGRISPDAVVLAKAGHVEDATQVQQVYKEALARAYAMGYTWQDAAYPAASQAAYFARQIREGFEAAAATAESDAGWDDVQDVLSVVSAISGTASAVFWVIAAGTSPTVFGGIAASSVALSLGFLSATCSIANAGITHVRWRGGGVDRDTMIASQTLNGLSLLPVPVLSAGASFSGMSIELTD